MAKISWKFNNYTFPVNPDEDSGWTVNPVISEVIPIYASQGSVQVGGIGSARRRISGWIFGSNSNSFKAQFDSWMVSGTVGTLTDHLNQSRRARLIRFEPAALRDAKYVRQGIQIWKYTAEFIAV